MVSLKKDLVLLVPVAWKGGLGAEEVICFCVNAESGRLEIKILPLFYLRGQAERRRWEPLGWLLG